MNEREQPRQPKGVEPEGIPAVGPGPEPEAPAEALPQLEAETGPDPPMIYVASLSDYNAGRLHGTWIDATQEVEDVAAAVTEMLASSPSGEAAEEYAIHDYSGFSGWQPDEYEALEDVVTMAQAMAEHGEAIGHWVRYLGESPAVALQSFQEAYRGAWESVEAYAQELIEEYEVEIEVSPKSWEMYVKVDIEALARDLQIELHCVRGSDGGVHVFDPGVV